METSTKSNRSKHSSKNAAMNIERLAEGLVHLFTQGKSRNEEIIKLKEKSQVLDDNNPDFNEIIYDRRENNKMNWRLAIILLTMGVDFVLVFQPMTIICDEFGFPGFLKFLVPAVLIVVEVGVSYFQILHLRSGEPTSWVTRNLQYFLLFILGAFTLIVVLYEAQAYNPDSDVISFLSFIVATIIVQVVLLIASLCLHLWLVRNSEQIAETFAFFHYKSDRKKLTNKIEKMEMDNIQKFLPEFTARVHSFIKHIETFKRDYPEVTIDFSITMPGDLIRAINQVMDRNYFNLPSDNL